MAVRDLQRIEKIEGLQGCPNLKKLWLIENQISVVENLEPCTGLQELYLTSNKITEIKGLDNLANLKVNAVLVCSSSSSAGFSSQQSCNSCQHIHDQRAELGCDVLQVLWLADNYISGITGISHLPNLQQLNLARNDIALIGSSLQQSTRLTSLNLADNQISCMQVS